MRKKQSSVLAATLIIGAMIVVQPFISSMATAQKKIEGIVEDPDIDPMYAGGSAEMTKFISRSLKYPAEAVAKNAQGLVVYTFVVELDGTLSNFDIIHRADSSLNEEALRIIKSMPPWRPAKYKGQFVRAKTYVPMYFRLNKNAAVNRTAARQAIAKTDTKIIENNDIYTIVDQMPVYPEGERALAEFLSGKIIYPLDAMQDGVQGEILCSFIVTKEGRITNIEIVRGLTPSLNDEAIRVLSIMPRWKAGINRGEPVNVKCLLPITFTIDEAPIPAAPAGAE